MAKGRPRKSVDAKILTGTFREDRDGPLAEAVRAEGVPQRPAHLSGDAAALWDAQVPGMIERRIVGSADAPMLTAMCESWGRYCKASEQLSKLRSMATDTARVLAIQVADALRCFNMIACRFGLTPADRTRLAVAPAKKAGVASRQRA